MSIADAGRERGRFWGAIRHKAQAMRRLMRQPGRPEELMVVYEAGPTGYGLQRQLQEMGIACIVAAPSLTPGRRSRDGATG